MGTDAKLIEALRRGTSLMHSRAADRIEELEAEISALRAAQVGAADGAEEIARVMVMRLTQSGGVVCGGEYGEFTPAGVETVKRTLRDFGVGALVGTGGDLPAPAA